MVVSDTAVQVYIILYIYQDQTDHSCFFPTNNPMQNSFRGMKQFFEKKIVCMCLSGLLWGPEGRRKCPKVKKKSQTIIMLVLVLFFGKLSQGCPRHHLRSMGNCVSFLRSTFSFGFIGSA